MTGTAALFAIRQMLDAFYQKDGLPMDLPEEFSCAIDCFINAFMGNELGKNYVSRNYSNKPV